jgi:hypothetical protein
MNLTIQTVDPSTRTWEGPKGTIEFISGQFTDGSGWSLGAKPENAQKRIVELCSLIGKPGEYEVEEKPEYQGVKQWKMKSWPGKPVFGGGSKAPRDETGMAIGAAGHDAAVIVAALIHEGVENAHELYLELYCELVAAIYENNQQLRAALPTSPSQVSTEASAAGTGVSTPPVSNTSETHKKAAGRKPDVGNGGVSDEWGAKPEILGEGTGDAPCSHKLWTEFRPDNETKLPKGFRRCTDCGKTWKA